MSIERAEKVWNGAQSAEAAGMIHPEDRETFNAGLVKGKELAGEFVTKYAEQMRRLIATWGDADAIEQLEALREVFWSGDKWRGATQ